MENVRGLLSAALKHRPITERPNKGGPELSDDEKPGSVVRLFAEDLANIHGARYHLDIYEVNSVNYGAPQIRERVLFFGNRYNFHVEFPLPTHGQDRTRNRNGSQPSLFDAPTLESWNTLGNVIADLDEENPMVLDFSPRKKRYLELVPAGSNWRSLPEEIQKESMGKAWYAKGGRSGWWRRVSFDLPSPTLVTMPNHASTSLCHPVETRALSIREYARIQEFPDEWEFSGSLADQYTQVGNAVPTRLGKISGEVIAKCLQQVDEDGLEPISARTSPPRIVYLQSHVRTRQWYRNGKAVIWSDDDDSDAAVYAAPKTVKRVRGLG